VLWFWIGADHREIFHLLYKVHADGDIISLPNRFYIYGGVVTVKNMDAHEEVFNGCGGGELKVIDSPAVVNVILEEKKSTIALTPLCQYCANDLPCDCSDPIVVAADGPTSGASAWKGDTILLLYMLLFIVWSWMENYTMSLYPSKHKILLEVIYIIV